VLGTVGGVINVVIASVMAAIIFENNHQVLHDHVTCNKNAIVAGTLQKTNWNYGCKTRRGTQLRG
jgi:hypothetical protein